MKLASQSGHNSRTSNKCLTDREHSLLEVAAHFFLDCLQDVVARKIFVLVEGGPQLLETVGAEDGDEGFLVGSC